MGFASSRTPGREVFLSVLHPEPLAARRPLAGQEPESWVLGGGAESLTLGQHWRVQLRLGPGREGSAVQEGRRVYLGLEMRNGSLAGLRAG